jgi:probable rRNA maturation factor
MADADHTPRVLVDDRQSSAVDVDGLVALAREVLIGEGVSGSELSLSFVTEAEIADLHRRYLGEEGPTDVLSFPLDGRDPLPADVPRQLGDLVICPARAEADGTALDVLMVHGALHLLGWDHETDAGEMLDRQAAVLEEVGARAAEPA